MAFLITTPMEQNKLTLTAISSWTLSLVEVNEFLQALTLVISAIAGLLAILKHFKAKAAAEPVKEDEPEK